MTIWQNDWRKSGELSNISAGDVRLGEIVADAIGIAIVCVILSFGFGVFS